MPASTLRDHLQTTALAFLWDEWSQMGVLASPRHESPWAQDPEALLLFTFEVARDDPRLFDEVLDWMVRNESIVSSQRLRNLCDGPDDERLVGAVLAWTAKQRRRTARERPTAQSDAEPLFRGVSSPVRTPDPVFFAHGLIRPLATPTDKSMEPDLVRPINFDFRLRHLLGISARAEVVRFLLTADVPNATVVAIAASAGYTKRNVQEALTALRTSGTVSQSTVALDQRYGIDRARWAHLLGADVSDLPTHRDWPQLLSALKAMLRWLHRPDLDDLSAYLRASQATDLLEEVQPRLSHAGVITSSHHRGDLAWEDLVETVDSALRALN